MVKKREMTVTERAIIYNRRKSGETLSSIAEDYDLSPEGVRDIFRRLEERGVAENMTRSGRKRKTQPRDDRQILKEVQKNCKVSAREIKDTLNLDISETTIKRRIRETGLGGYVARSKPYISPANRKKRVAFAKEYFSNPLDFWKSIIWSDESKFELLSCNRRQYVWRKKGEAFKIENLKPTVKHGGGSLMVWGCVSYYGVGKLCFIDGKMNGPGYVEILEKNLLRSIDQLGMRNEYVFQQDNDPKHTSRVATKFFEINSIPVLPWPPQSPDINIIEHVWNYIDRKIPMNERKNKNDFKNAIINEWSNVTSNYLKKLVESVPNRLLKVIQANGGPTKY